jgi:hypothetical protein
MEKKGLKLLLQNNTISCCIIVMQPQATTKGIAANLFDQKIQ